MKRYAVVVVFLAAVVVRAGGPEPASVPAVPGHVVDLTHPFDEHTIYWPTDLKGFQLAGLSHGMTDAGYFYSANRFCAAEHGGTHLDAPIHFQEHGRALDEIPAGQLVGPGAVVDVRAKCAADPDYLVGVADLQAWEAEHGRLPDGAIVLLDTGWGARWSDRAAYLGTSKTGPEAIPELHFPGLDPEAARWLASQRHVGAVGLDTPGLDPAAARWLASQRHVGAVGLDTPSIDHGPSKSFASHVALFAANIPALENVAGLDDLPPRGLVVAALPMKIAGGSGGPLRIVAWW